MRLRPKSELLEHMLLCRTTAQIEIEVFTLGIQLFHGDSLIIHLYLLFLPTPSLANAPLLYGNELLQPATVGKDRQTKREEVPDKTNVLASKSHHTQYENLENLMDA